MSSAPSESPLSVSTSVASVESTHAPTLQRAARAFVRFAWALAAYLLAVILFGAWVRISGSGAGCGDHWPLCNGELVPPTPSMKTVIEYTHRLTSGLAGPWSLALVIWAWRGFRAQKAVRMAALATLGFVLLEGGIGAGLVLKELVASDASAARATVIALHLVNTFGLMASVSLCAHWATPAAPKQRVELGLRRGAQWCAVALVLVGATGAVTALGDTLFPVLPYAEDTGWFAHLRDDLQAGTHFLVRLRLWHPVLAVVVSVLVLTVFGKIRETAGAAASLAGWGSGLVFVQLGLGALNIFLHAPAWLQLAHLLCAQVLWCVLCVILAKTEALPIRALPTE